jgi:hypothetical protein
MKAAAMFAFGMALLFSVGCGDVRLSREQAQAVVDAREGAVALESGGDDVAAGVAGRLDGALANATDLPSPLYSRHTLRDPSIAAGYAQSGRAIRSNPPSGATWTQILAVVGGGLAAALPLIYGGLRLAKNVPGVTGVVAGLVEHLWNATAPNQLKDADAATRAALVSSFSVIEETLEALESAAPGDLRIAPFRRQLEQLRKVIA